MKTKHIALHLTILVIAMVSTLFSASSPKSISARPELVFTPTAAGPALSLTISESGNFIAVGRNDGTTEVLDRHGKVQATWPSLDGACVTLCAVNERMGLVVSASRSEDVTIRRIEKYEVQSTQQLDYTASTVAFHPKDPVVLIGTDELNDKEGLVRCYDPSKKRWDVILDTKKIEGTEVKMPGVYAMEFSPDGTRLAVLTRSTVLMLDWKSMKIVRSIAWDGKQLFQSLRFTHDGKQLVLSDHNRTFWVYDTTKWECQKVEIADDNQMKRFCITRNDKYLCATIMTPAGRSPGCWAIFSFPDIKPLVYVTAHESLITHIVSDPKDDKIWTAGFDGKVMLWSLAEVLRAKK